MDTVRTIWQFAMLPLVLIGYGVFILAYTIAYGVDAARDMHCFLWVDDLEE
jgi:hypothetical protein